jgi:predicted dehydrogenase
MTPDGPIGYAMVGGGPGSFIGPVHRMAAELDGRFRLVAGVFSSDAARNKEAARQWGIGSERTYADADALFAAERARPDGARMVIVTTPNNLHKAVSCAALRSGIHVMSEKPATLDLAEALELAAVVAQSGQLYGLTHGYTGYPMIREARDIVHRGDLGTVRKVVVEYPQGWLSRPVEREGSKQASWRADPAKAGIGGCLGDIGVHAFNIAEFVTGLSVEQLFADVSTMVAGRMLDDDANVLLRFRGGARGVLICSQISAGARNGLGLQVYGEKGGLSWSHERHTELRIDWLDGPGQILHAGSYWLSDAARTATRLPAGHPEGFIEAFANLYRDFADAIRAGRADAGPVPGIAEGVRGMAFVEAAVAAGRPGAGWIQVQDMMR